MTDSNQKSRLSRRSALAVGAVSTLALAIPVKAMAQDDGGVPDIIQQLLDAYTGNDAEGAKAVFAEDGVFEHVPYGLEFNGHDEILEVHTSLLEQHESIAFTDVTGFEAGSNVAAEATWTSMNIYDAPGTNPGPDETTYRFAIIGTVNDEGLLTRASFYAHIPDQEQVEATPTA